jgi:hypothetical protein
LLKSLADENVILALVLGLRRRGMDVLTVQDLGKRGEDDPLLLDIAYQRDRIVLTNDQDFLSLAAERASRQELFAPIFYWPQQQRTVGELLGTVLPLAATLSYEEACSRVFFL